MTTRLGYVVRWQSSLTGQWAERWFGTSQGAEEYLGAVRGTVDANAYAVSASWDPDMPRPVVDTSRHRQAGETTHRNLREHIGAADALAERGLEAER